MRARQSALEIRVEQKQHHKIPGFCESGLCYPLKTNAESQENLNPYRWILIKRDSFAWGEAEGIIDKALFVCGAEGSWPTPEVGALSEKDGLSAKNPFYGADISARAVILGSLQLRT